MPPYSLGVRDAGETFSHDGKPWGLSLIGLGHWRLSTDARPLI